VYAKYLKTHYESDDSVANKPNTVAEVFNQIKTKFFSQENSSNLEELPSESERDFENY